MEETSASRIHSFRKTKHSSKDPKSHFLQIKLWHSCPPAVTFPVLRLMLLAPWGSRWRVPAGGTFSLLLGGPDTHPSPKQMEAKLTNKTQPVLVSGTTTWDCVLLLTRWGGGAEKLQQACHAFTKLT